MLRGAFDGRAGSLSSSGDGVVSCSLGAATVLFSGVLFNRKELAQGEENEAEIVARLYRQKGTAAFAELNGPFAIALFDGTQLVLVRDQLGQSFLFFHDDGREVCFSESLNDVLDERERDWQAFADYLSLGYIPASRTIWRDVVKLPAATAVLFRNGVRSLHRYWTPVYEPSRRYGFVEAARETERLVLRAIRRCLELDDKAGFLLSGGIDSSLLLSLTAKAFSAPRKAFTVGFADPRYDERALAQTVARNVGAEHVTRQVEPSEFTEFMKALKLSGEPFADSSLLPDCCAMKLAASQCRTVLLGDGGDEFFGGYRRYRVMALRERLGEGLSRLGGGVASLLANLLPPASEGRTSRSSLARLGKALSLPPVPCYASFQELFSPDELTALAPDLFAQKERYGEIGSYHAQWREVFDGCPGVNGVNLIDLLYYLPDDGSRKEGLAAEYAGVKAFSPLLDMDVVRFALTLPIDCRLSIRRGKLLLRHIGREYLPDEILHQVKRGFGMPVSAWLRKELKPYAAELPDKLDAFGCFSKSFVRRMVNEHFAGAADHGPKLWALICCGEV